MDNKKNAPTKKSSNSPYDNLDLTSFLPTSVKEMELHGWDELDVVVFTGDAYIDHPSFGASIVARVMESEGLKVGIVPQPNWRDDLRDFKKFGRPRLFFSVGAGSMDSMVNHYTAAKRRRSDDAYTPEARAGQRPDNASIVYCNILKDLYPEVPILLGGIEASLRRFAHYDYWEDSVRPSILQESKADMLTYGMSEQCIREIVRLMQKGVPFESLTTVPQTALLVNKLPSQKVWKDVHLHSFAKNVEDKKIYAQDFRTMEENGNAYLKKRLVQSHGDRLLVVNPGYPRMTTKEMDEIYSLPFTRLPHPRYKGKRIPAYDMIKNSVSTHRGCFGGCSFCAIYSHEGKFISSRSQESVMDEVGMMTSDANFNGVISDLGGPSANMYQMKGLDESQCKSCRRVSCLYPRVCKNLQMDHNPITQMYKKANAMDGVKHCYVGSGIRYDMLIDVKGNYLSNDKAKYLYQMITEHTSGRLTVAPEHTSTEVLKNMRKPVYEMYESFEAIFKKIAQKAGKKFQIIPYFISSHPGSQDVDMAELAVKAKEQKMFLEQVQDFTPTPMTLATTMFYTGINPYTGDEVYVAKTKEQKLGQRRFFFWYKKEEQRGIREVLRKIGRSDLEQKLFVHKPKADDASSKTGKFKSKGKSTGGFKGGKKSSRRNDDKKGGGARIGKSRRK